MIPSHPLPWRIALCDGRVYLLARDDATVTEIFATSARPEDAIAVKLALARCILEAVNGESAA